MVVKKKWLLLGLAAVLQGMAFGSDVPYALLPAQQSMQEAGCLCRLCEDWSAFWRDMNRDCVCFIQPCGGGSHDEGCVKEEVFSLFRAWYEDRLNKVDAKIEEQSKRCVCCPDHCTAVTRSVACPLYWFACAAPCCACCLLYCVCTAGPDSGEPLPNEHW